MSKKKNFEESLIKNMHSFSFYRDRLEELALSSFEWLNTPVYFNEEYFEKVLYHNGQAVFFHDEVIGYLGLSVAAQGSFDVYGNPKKFRAYSNYNNYTRDLDNSNAVLVYNNYKRTPLASAVTGFAKRLYDLDSTIDVNARAQKTPVLIKASQQNRLTLLNLYKEYDGNAPVIFGDKNLDLSGISVVKTDAPYVGDKLYQLKQEIWNEALTYLGIPNVAVTKKERLITDEVQRSMGGTLASRNSRLAARQKACKKINEMFGLNMGVRFRDFGIDRDQSEEGEEDE